MVGYDECFQDSFTSNSSAGDEAPMLGIMYHVICFSIILVAHYKVLSLLYTSSSIRKSFPFMALVASFHSEYDRFWTRVMQAADAFELSCSWFMASPSILAFTTLSQSRIGYLVLELELCRVKMEGLDRVDTVIIQGRFTADEGGRPTTIGRESQYEAAHPARPRPDEECAARNGGRQLHIHLVPYE